MKKKMLALRSVPPEIRSWGANPEKSKKSRTSRRHGWPVVKATDHGVLLQPVVKIFYRGALSSPSLLLQALDILSLYLNFLSLNSSYLTPSIFLISSPVSILFTLNHPLSLNISSFSINFLSFFFCFFKLISSTIPILFSLSLIHI